MPSSLIVRARFISLVSVELLLGIHCAGSVPPPAAQERVFKWLPPHRPSVVHPVLLWRLKGWRAWPQLLALRRGPCPNLRNPCGCGILHARCPITGLNCPVSSRVSEQSSKEVKLVLKVASEGGRDAGCISGRVCEFRLNFSKSRPNGTMIAAASWMPISFEPVGYRIHNRS